MLPMWVWVGLVFAALIAAGAFVEWRGRPRDGDVMEMPDGAMWLRDGDGHRYPDGMPFGGGDLWLPKARAVPEDYPTWEWPEKGRTEFWTVTMANGRRMVVRQIGQPKMQVIVGVEDVVDR